MARMAATRQAPVSRTKAARSAEMPPIAITGAIVGGGNLLHRVDSCAPKSGRGRESRGAPSTPCFVTVDG